MISSLFKFVANLFIGIMLIICGQSYFDFSPNFPDAYLYIGLFSWLLTGTILGRFYFKDSSLTGAWSYPTKLITAPIGFGLICLLTILSFPELTQPNALHLMWLIAPSLIFSWVIVATNLKFGKSTVPYLFLLTTTAHIQLLVLLSGFAYLYLDGRPPQKIFFPKSSNHYLLTVCVLIASWGLTALYVSLLRSFNFYQIKEHLLDQTMNIDYETKRMIATHEAGHCLCYCFFKTPPAQIKIYLFEKALAKQQGAYGLVEATIPVLKTKEFNELNLLVMLAGQRAELAIHKKTSKGASDDVAKWKASAHAFLAQYDRKYFDQPENEMQMVANAEKEKQLFNKHTQILDLFFEKNKSLIKVLAAKAYRFNPLEAHQIHPILAKVKITKGFPKEEKKSLW